MLSSIRMMQKREVGKMSVVGSQEEPFELVAVRLIMHIPGKPHVPLPITMSSVRLRDKG